MSVVLPAIMTSVYKTMHFNRNLHGKSDLSTSSRDLEIATKISHKLKKILLGDKPILHSLSDKLW